MPTDPAPGSKDHGQDPVNADYQTLLREMIALGHQTLARPIKPPLPDIYSTMLWSFAQKTLYHARSVSLLADHDLEHDASLIVRSMLEGLGQLIWMHKEPQTRPIIWRDFGVVEHYRWIQRRLDRGGEVQDATKTVLEARLRSCGQQFLRTKKKPIGELFTPGSEGWFRMQWLPTNEWKADAHMRGYLDWFYDDFSGWMHWSFTAIQDLVKIEEEALEFAPRRDLARQSALALAAGILSDVLRGVSAELKLGLADHLDQLITHYLGRDALEEAKRPVAPST